MSLYVGYTIYRLISKCRYKQTLPLLVTAMSTGSFPDFADTGFPTFWNFMVASDDIAKKPPAIPQDAQSKLSKTQ